MEKTTQITIASTVFSLTEGAYAKLSEYLDALKARFSGEPGRDEIVSDIENRIAEKLFSKKDGVVLEADIAAVIVEIGDASEIGGEESGSAHEGAGGKKRLYRNMDDAYLGGVCSGIAAYFDIDPLWVRLSAIGVTLITGFGAILYLILWFLVPEAKSTSQKLEMRGKPVTLDTIARVVKIRVEEIEKRGVLTRTGRFINHMVSRLWSFAGTILGILLSFFSIAALIGLSIALGVILTNWNAPYNDFPLREAVPHLLLIGGAVAGYLAILIPLILVFSLGMRLVRRKILIPGPIGLGLIGVWALCIIALGVIGFKVAGEFYQYTQTNPSYTEHTQVLEVAPFDSLTINNQPVTIRYGDTHAVTITGRESDTGQVAATVKDGVLTIIRTPQEQRMCLFCAQKIPSVVIETPTLIELNLEDSSAVLENMSARAIAIDLQDSSLRGSLEASSLALKGHDSYTNIEGTLNTLQLELRDSTFRGSALRSADGNVSAWDSTVTVFVTDNFTVTHSSDSRIENSAKTEALE